MEEQNTNVDTEEKQRKPFKRFIGLGVAIVAVVAVGLFIHDALMYESTDDAYVETTTVQVAPRVSGQIVDVFITDNQKSKKAIWLQKLTLRIMKLRWLKRKQNMTKLF